jgi:hypothetical protein
MSTINSPIDVYIIGTNNKSQITNLFSDTTIFNKPIVTQEQWLSLLANKQDKYTLFIKDDSISILSPLLMSQLIKDIITNNQRNNGDVVFLSFWGDKCQLHHHSADLSNNFSLYTSQQPRGLQAILVTPSGSNNILTAMENGITDDLSHHIHKGELKAEVVLPSPISFDLTQATDNNDYLKMNMCQAVKICTRELPSPEVPLKTSWWSYLLIVIILLLLLFIVYRSRK